MGSWLWSIDSCQNKVSTGQYHLVVSWAQMSTHPGRVYTECKYGGSLGQPGSSCAKARLVRPQEFCFDCGSQQLSRSIWFPSSCYVLKSHQRGDLTPAETKVDYLCFAKVLYEERNGFKRFGAANGSTLLFFQFALSVLLLGKGKHPRERVNPPSRLTNL